MGSLSTDLWTRSDSPVRELSSTFRLLPWSRIPSAGSRSPGEGRRVQSPAAMPITLVSGSPVPTTLASGPLTITTPGVKDQGPSSAMPITFVSGPSFDPYPLASGIKGQADPGTSPWP